MAGVETTRAERFKSFQQEVGFVLTYLLSRGFSWSPEYEVFVPPESANIVYIVETTTYAMFLCGAAHARGQDAGFQLRELEDLRDTIMRTARKFAKDRMKSYQ